MKTKPSIFGAFDIRGKYPEDISVETAQELAQAIVSYFKPKTLVVGRDIRPSSKEIHQPFIKTLTDNGVEVFDVGEVSTGMLYFAVPELKADGGIMITASHNPSGWTGFKIVREEGKPVSQDSGLKKIEQLFNNKESITSASPGKVVDTDISQPYYQKIQSLADFSKIKPLKVVIDTMNGIAGKTIKPIIKELPIEAISINQELKPDYPEGAPNPILPKRQEEIKAEIKKTKADLGIAFDGDGDRVIFFDEQAEFIPNCYMVALLAQEILNKNNNQGKIIHEARLTWIINDLVKQAGGTPIEIRIGHAFFKEKMRQEQALFAGESTGHFFYKEFNYSDAALLTMVYVLELLSKKGQSVSGIIQPLKDEVAVMPETSFETDRPEEVIKRVGQEFSEGKTKQVDGLTVETRQYRFNLRPSQTQPLIRLNLETRDYKILERKKAELINFIEQQGAKIIA